MYYFPFSQVLPLENGHSDIGYLTSFFALASLMVSPQIHWSCVSLHVSELMFILHHDEWKGKQKISHYGPDSKPNEDNGSDKQLLVNHL